MEKKRATNGKFKTFLKKNIYYIIMAICLLAIAAMVTVALVTKNSDGGSVDVGPSLDINNPPAEDNMNNDEHVKDPSDVVPNPPPEDNANQTPAPAPTPTAIVFACPVSDANVLKDYCMDTLVWNQTLKHYAVHNGIDFAGADGTDVMSAYSGVISNIKYDVLNGYTVTISHNDNLTTTYSSLNEPSVTVGQVVRKGEKIGTMGATATNEYLDGAHVHFCLYENGKIADPYDYLDIGDK